MARWEAAHDALLDLYTFHNSPLGDALVRMGWVEPNLATVHDPVTFKRNYGDFGGYLRDTLFNADPIYVDDHMMTLVEAAAATFAPERIVPEDLPTMTGFVLFPRSVVVDWGRRVDQVERDDGTRVVTLPTASPSETRWRAALWSLVHNASGVHGVNVTLFEDTLTAEWVKWKREHADRTPLLSPPPLVMSHTNTWPIDANMRVPERSDGPWYDDMRYLQVLWRLMNQTITIKNPRDVGGQFRRRAERARFEPRRVTVVTLRRPDAPHDPDHVPHTVEWDHQWVVAGHWRNQWYPSISTHRQIWISPYVKGPEDKPLVLPKVRAFQLVR